MREVISSVRRVRGLMRDLGGAVQKAEARGLRLSPMRRIGSKKGFWILLVLALVAWWFWERDRRKARQNAPPILKS